MSGRLMMTSHSLPTTLLYRATVVSRPLAENNNLETYHLFQIRPMVACMQRAAVSYRRAELFTVIDSAAPYRNMLLRFMLLLGVIWCPLTAAESPSSLVARLIAGYGSRSVRPSMAEGRDSTVCPSSTPPADLVEVQVYVEQYQPLNMLRQTYAIDGFLRAWWNDPRLRYNSTAEGGCTDELSLKHADRQKIWMPEFYWEGAKDVTLSSASLGELLKVDPSGNVWWSRQVSFVLSCPFSEGKNLDKMPFDTQTCDFMMGMYAEDASEVVLKWRADKVAMDNWNGTCLAEWHATRHSQEDVLQTYASVNYTYAKASIAFTRAPNNYMDTYFLPSVLMVMISMLGFYIDPAVTPARVALGMICMLVVMTNFVSLVKALPPTATPTWLARFAFSSFLFNFVAMIEQVMVSFGLQSKKWLDAQKEFLAKTMDWKKALVLNKAVLNALCHDSERKFLTKKDFRRGVMKLGLEVSVNELNGLFDHFDTDGDGALEFSELNSMFAEIEAELKSSERSSKHAGGSESQHSSSIRTVTISEVSASAVAPKIQDGGEEEAAMERMTSSAGQAPPSPRKPRDLKRAATRASMHAQQEVLQFYRDVAKDDLDRGRIWTFKVFYLFPLLLHLSRLDHICRLLFPIAYIIYVLIAFSEVGFGTEHLERLRGSPCYMATWS